MLMPHLLNLDDIIGVPPPRLGKSWLFQVSHGMKKSGHCTSITTVVTSHKISCRIPPNFVYFNTWRIRIFVPSCQSPYRSSLYKYIRESHHPTIDGQVMGSQVLLMYSSTLCQTDIQSFVDKQWQYNRHIP